VEPAKAQCNQILRCSSEASTLVFSGRLGMPFSGTTDAFRLCCRYFAIKADLTSLEGVGMNSDTYYAPE
jgi:hypothetical protein